MSARYLEQYIIKLPQLRKSSSFQLKYCTVQMTETNKGRGNTYTCFSPTVVKSKRKMGRIFGAHGKMIKA
jgi:hypothetical protein